MPHQLLPNMNSSSATITPVHGGFVTKPKNPIPMDKIRRVNPTEPVRLPLLNYHNEPVEALVAVGDTVHIGSMLASNIVASVSGVVSAIEHRHFIHPSGQTQRCVEIQPDHKNTITTLPPLDPNRLDSLTPYALVGLGGAAYPLFDKVQTARNAGVSALIINAVECEPLVDCDNALIQQSADTCIQGIELLMRLCHVENASIAIKASMQRAIDALRQVLSLRTEKPASIELQLVQDKYPAGAERTLIQTLNVSKNPLAEPPSHQGLLCINIATAEALYHAYQGRPMTGRVISVTSPKGQTQNIWAPFGTRIRDILDVCGQDRYDGRVVAGGPLSGQLVDDLQLPVSASTNSLLLQTPSERADAQACIRCGDCATVCPSHLLPQQLYWYAQAEQVKTAVKFGLLECVECACCDLVCPSSIPLTQLFRYTKHNHHQIRDEQHRSEWAQQRFAEHQLRETERLSVKTSKKAASNPLDRLKQQRKKTTSSADGATLKTHNSGERVDKPQTPKP